MDKSNRTVGKGKSREYNNHNNDDERTGLLAAQLPADNSSISSSSRIPFSEQVTPTRTRHVRHGRGPLVRDSDDEDADSVRSSRGSHIRHYSTQSLSLNSVFCVSFMATFFVLLLLFALVHLWLGHLISEQAKAGSIDQIARRGLRFTGPSSVSIRDGNDESDIILVIKGEAGIDVRTALNWENKDSGSWIRRTEGKLAKWGIGKVQTVEATVGRIVVLDADAQRIQDNNDVESYRELVFISDMNPILLPLSYPSLQAQPRMDKITLELPISFPSPDHLATFLRHMWEIKRGEFHLVLQDIRVTPGQVGGFWGKVLNKFGAVSVPRVDNHVTANLPDFPEGSDPLSLVALQEYNILPSPNSSSIIMEASARLTNPLRLKSSELLPPFLRALRKLSYGIPFDLPIDVFLPPTQSPPPSFSSASPKNESKILLAKVVTHPFNFLNGAKSTLLTLDGRLEPIGNLSSVSAPSSSASGKETATKKEKEMKQTSSALSEVVARYLSGQNSTILARYGSPESFPSFFVSTTSPNSNGTAHYPPAFVGELVRDLEIPLILPGSATGQADLFKNLRIEEMKIRLSSMFSFSDSDEEPEGDLLCSGRVMGELVLPDHFSSLAEVIDVTELMPDVYVYDGGLPTSQLSTSLSPSDQLSFSSTSFSNFASDYPPVPTPATAFARLHPSTYITAITTHIPANSTHNATTLISATFIDAPLFLLPGRSDVFRRFVGKILFGGPNVKVMCGVKGVAGIEVGMKGWGEIGLQGLPIEGEFNVGRSGVEG